MPDVAALIAVPLPLRIPMTVVESVRAGVVPPDDVPASPLAVATLTAVIGAVPDDAEVIWPCALTVMLALVYEAAETPVFEMAIVTGADPLKLEPLNPVPIVRGFATEAVMVVEPPRATVLPLIVIDELLSAEFGMLVSVFDAPLMVLLVRA